MSLTKLSKTFRGIRFRLTVVYSTLFGLFICIFAFIISGQFLESSREDFDSALLNYAIDISNQLSSDKSNFKKGVHLPASESKKIFPFLLSQTHYTVRSIEGNILLTSSPDLKLPYLKTLAEKDVYTHGFFSVNDVNENPFRGLNLKIRNRSGKDYILQVATPSSILEEQFQKHVIINAITIPLLILLSSIAAYAIAENSLTPIKTLTDAANTIAAQNLSHRVPEMNTGDEVEELSKTINNLLERLEKSFKAQENFVANASHQLNTPLAIIKGELDLLERKDRKTEDVVQFHKSLREEIGRLIELVKNMLLISRVEAGQESFIFHEIRIDELLLAITSRLSTKAKEKRINIKFNISGEQDFIVLGEKQLLDSMIENIMENAIKYSPEESIVKLDLKIHDGSTEIWIEDEGPGINDEDLQRILSGRFNRGSRVLLPGNGIGLVLAYQIAEYHKAKIIYKSLSSKGSLFIIRF